MKAISKEDQRVRLEAWHCLHRAIGVANKIISNAEMEEIHISASPHEISFQRGYGCVINAVSYLDQCMLRSHFSANWTDVRRRMKANRFVLEKVAGALRELAHKLAMNGDSSAAVKLLALAEQFDHWRGKTDGGRSPRLHPAMPEPSA